jgi:uncharacterized protein DUF4403
MRKIFLGGLVLTILFGSALWAFVMLFGDSTTRRPALADSPPLKATSGVSSVYVPVAVANKAIRDAIEPQAPRNLTGKREYPLSEFLGKADVDWNINRGPLAIDGRSQLLAVTTVISGQVRITGQAGNQVSQIGDLIGGSVGRTVGNLAGKPPFDQKLDINGNVTITAKPILTPNWRIEPNLAAKVALADRKISISGFKFDVLKEVKPYLDRTVDEGMAKLQAQLRDDPTLEQTARREWAKMCRSISLGAAGPNMPALWIEVKPTRAVAAQPRIDPNWVILTLGVHAETRVVSGETKPSCPFPAELELAPPTDSGKIAIAVPIDLPFTELSRLLDAQLKGKTFPDRSDAPVHVTVHKATLAASGDRLLIALKVRAKEEKSWWGLGADADVFVWGTPTLDSKAQILRFTGLTLDVESESAFGLAGAAARAAIPYVQNTLEEQAVIDLKPMASTARKSIEAAIADFQKQADGMKMEASVTGIRLGAIQFDAKTLRVIAEIEGTARGALTKLP